MENSWIAALGQADLRQHLYLNNHSWQARLPDHVFDFGFQAAEAKGLRDGTLASTSLHLLAERYLCVPHGRVHVLMDHFGEWQQSVLSRVSALPIIAAKQASHLSISGYLASTSADKVFPSRAHELSLPCITPWDPTVEDYIRTEGVHESHLHLNGSTFAEQCWLRALEQPERDVKAFSALWQEARRSAAGDKVKELARLHDQSFQPVQFRQDLYLARNLRRWLINAAINDWHDIDKWPCRATHFLGRVTDTTPPSIPYGYELSQKTSSEQLSGELDWMTRLLSKLIANNGPSRVDRMFHLYLLLEHQYRQLMVQGEELYGFDLFQKYTNTELRNEVERNYVQRFIDMHGQHENYSQTGYLEGRFAPKNSAVENTALLQSILGGYLAYMQGGRRAAVRLGTQTLAQTLTRLDALIEPRNARQDIELSANSINPQLYRWPNRQQLALVVHFIKEPWSSGAKGGSYRFFSLRKKLDRQMGQLRITLKDYPRLNRWVRGIDGAANELHAPPEVFAPVFRQAVRAGVTHRTFHVGEDFPHLLTGLRHMLDAIELLDLRDGARIGHGTALGIDPNLWLGRMPSTLQLRCGERLLDLLGAWRMLRELPNEQSAAYQLEIRLNELLPQVFPGTVTPALFERAMKLRDLHPGLIAKFMSKSSISRNSANRGTVNVNDNLDMMSERVWNWRTVSYVDAICEEGRLVSDAAQRDPEAVMLLWVWLSDKTLWQRSEKVMSVETQDSVFTPALYLRIQQALMERVAKRRVVIETLPSSNVRISQYERFEEHHALRWMAVPGHKKEGDTPIMVSLGSDDPGIFAGNLVGELYQLYAVLRQKGMSDTEALKRVADLNQRGRQYRFHDPDL